MKKKSETAITVKQEQPKMMSVAGLISQGLTTGASVDAMKGLYELFEKERADARMISFNDAMGTFQSRCPIIKKTKAVKTYSGEVKYYYAPLESIVSQVSALIQECGFSYRIQSEMTASGVKATCIVKHREGHSEETSVEVSKMKGAVNRDGKALMSAPQEDAATLTYAKRYAFCNAFGILTGDEDTDAVQPQGSTVVKDKEKEIEQTQFDIALNYVTNERSPKMLIEARTKVNDSKEFTNQQKITLIGIINDKLKPKI